MFDPDPNLVPDYGCGSAKAKVAVPVRQHWSKQLIFYSLDPVLAWKFYLLAMNNTTATLLKKNLLKTINSAVNRRKRLTKNNSSFVIFIPYLSVGLETSI